MITHVGIYNSSVLVFIDLILTMISLQLISKFKPIYPPWERPASSLGISHMAKTPTQMSPDELEIALFERFLNARFVNGYGFRP